MMLEQNKKPKHSCFMLPFPPGYVKHLYEMKVHYLLNTTVQRSE